MRHIQIKPELMVGEISGGMLFDVSFDNGIVPVLAVPEKEVPDGSSAG